MTKLTNCQYPGGLPLHKCFLEVLTILVILLLFFLSGTPLNGVAVTGGQAFVIKLRATAERSTTSKVVEPPAGLFATPNGTDYIHWRHMKYVSLLQTPEQDINVFFHRHACG